MRSRISGGSEGAILFSAGAREVGVEGDWSRVAVCSVERIREGSGTRETRGIGA